MVWVWYGEGVEMVVYRSQGRNLALEWEWGGMGVVTVLKPDYTITYLIC